MIKLIEIYIESLIMAISSVDNKDWGGGAQ